MKLRINLEGESYDVVVEFLPDTDAKPEPELEIDFADLPLPPPPPELRPQDHVCRTPIAGAVIAINVKPGQYVEKDHPIVMLEAMKMQVAIGAPVDGIIEDMQVKLGQSLLPGQVICTVS